MSIQILKFFIFKDCIQTQHFVQCNLNIHIHVTTCMCKKVHMERSNLRFAYCKDYGICKTLKSFDSKVIGT